MTLMVFIYVYYILFTCTNLVDVMPLFFTIFSFHLLIFGKNCPVSDKIRPKILAAVPAGSASSRPRNASSHPLLRSTTASHVLSHTRKRNRGGERLWKKGALTPSPSFWKRELPDCATALTALVGFLVIVSVTAGHVIQMQTV
jgi:hypothetical protein